MERISAGRAPESWLPEALRARSPQSFPIPSSELRRLSEMSRWHSESRSLMLPSPGPRWLLDRTSVVRREQASGARASTAPGEPDGGHRGPNKGWARCAAAAANGRRPSHQSDD